MGKLVDLKSVAKNWDGVLMEDVESGSEALGTEKQQLGRNGASPRLWCWGPEGTDSGPLGWQEGRCSRWRIQASRLMEGRGIRRGRVKSDTRSLLLSCSPSRHSM